MNVYICSLLSPEGSTGTEIWLSLEENINRAKKACRFAIAKGCVPYAPHLYFTQFLSEAKERELGLSLGLKWLAQCNEVWIIGNKITTGMQAEIHKARKLGIPIKQIQEDQMLSLVDRFMRENISLYPQAEIHYGSDVAYVTHPCHIATVGLEICAGYALQLIVDRMRKKYGFKPLEPINGEDYDKDCDQEGEYYFYVGLNDYTDSKVDSTISVMFDNSTSPDSGGVYEIDLSEEEQIALYNRLDEESRKVYGMSCEELLEEARRQMSLRG